VGLSASVLHVRFDVADFPDEACLKTRPGSPGGARAVARAGAMMPMAGKYVRYRRNLLTADR
jgi:hypothetical protein